MIISLLVFLAVATPGWLYGQDQVRDLVVKVHAVRLSPNTFRPWSQRSPQNVHGSGIIVEGKRILTAAHVVQHANQIYVQPNQSAERLPARVIASAPGMDLALLQVEDDSFFERRRFLPMSEDLPTVRDEVAVYGYPTGGAELSVTQGIVSRIEFGDYYYAAMGLRIQVDAALNPGNSGGPAISEGKLVGLVFSVIPSAQSVGYLIPVEEIRLFLEDIADGVYDGKPQLPDRFQTVENSALRKRLGLGKETGGLMVVDPYLRSEDYPLKEWDVVTRIGGWPIDKDGKVAVRSDLRLSALYLIQKSVRQKSVELGVYREGKEISLPYPARLQKEWVIPHLRGSPPRYFIYGPLAFSQATQEYLEGLGSRGESALARQSSPLIHRRYDKPAFPGEELVIVCAPMFPHRITQGYSSPETAVVQEVNGIAVKNLSHLVEVLRDASDPQLVFRVAKMSSYGQEALIFNREEIRAATEEVLNENGIRHQYSSDLAPVWLKTAPR
jgi:S1-C subfamily serine protease